MAGASLNENRIGLLIWQTSNLWQSRIRKQIIQFNISFNEYIILETIYNLSKSLSNINQVDIVKNSFIDKSVVSAKLTQLNKKKLIKKMSSNDNRSNKLALTREGIIVVENIINDVIAVENVFFSKLNQETFNFINSLKLLLGKKLESKQIIMSKINLKYYKNIKSWPFKEAEQIIKRNGGFANFKTPNKGYVLLETGYGPSGLPHIGTFGEVVRTTMVRNALMSLVNCPTKLIAFSDDMDGLRKVPDNVPNKDMLSEYIGKPLTSIPDPFEKYESFGHHNNAKLRTFLDEFKFDYNFISSTEQYHNGFFDSTIIDILQNYEKILEIILPTLRKDRKITYSPFLPISEQSGNVLQVKIEEYRPKSKSIIYTEPLNQKRLKL